MTVSSVFSSYTCGKASASDSRLVINFLEGRLRFWDQGLDFSIREINAECLIVRLSLFVVMKALLDVRRPVGSLEVVAVGLDVRGVVDFLRAVGGAWVEMISSPLMIAPIL